MNLAPDQLLTKTPQGINASRSAAGMSPKAHTLLKLFDGTMTVAALKRLCLAESLADSDCQIALIELVHLEHIRVVDPAAGKPDTAAEAEAERKFSLTLDFTPWAASAPSPTKSANANPAPAVPPATTNAAARAGVASPAIARDGAIAAAAAKPTPQEDKSARLKLEVEVRQKLIAALQPKVEEELRSRLRPKLEQELRPKLIAALRPGLEAEIRTALTKELAPRVELELKTRMAKTLAAQKAAEQQAVKAAPVADIAERDPPAVSVPEAVAAPATAAAAPPVVEPVVVTARVPPADADSGGFERVLASLNLPVFSIDKLGVCTYMSPSWVQFSGYTTAEVVGKSFVDFFAEGSRRAILSMLTGIANGTALRFEQQGELLRKGSSPLWVEISAAPLYAASGQPVGVCGAIHDAAESRRLTDQAEADGMRLLLLVDQIDTGVILEDRDGNIQQANPALCTLLSLDAASYSLEGMPVAELHATAAKGFIGPEGFLRRVAEIRAAGVDAKGESFVMTDGRVLSQDYLEVTAGESIVGYLWLYREMLRPQARSAG